MSDIKQITSNDKPSLFKWFMCGIIWDIAMFLPAGKLFFAMTRYSGDRFLFRTYQECSNHYDELGN